MTRQHFKALAAALHTTLPDDSRVSYLAGTGYDTAYLQWRQTVIAVADACARFNANFDRKRFYRAAGLEG